MGFIDKSFIDQVVESTDLLSVITDFVKLEKNGASWKGLSPFVDEKSPSFMVSPSKGVWKCFSSGIGGNSPVEFLMQLKKTYPEAIEYLAGKQSIPVKYSDDKKAAEYAQRKEKEVALLPVLKASAAAYHKEYLESGDLSKARLEVKKRGYSADIVETYNIGYAPGHQFLYKKMSENGRVAQGVQLALINAKNHDRYWDRLIYPIHNAGGDIIGLAGRDLSGSPKSAKWINSSDTLLYDKSSVWYALHLAKSSIAKEGCAYLVEGYNDVISFRESGIPNTISPCGTAITEQQVKILKRFCSR